MSAFAVVFAPEPVRPAELPKSRNHRRQERRAALLPQAAEESVPFMGQSGFRVTYKKRLLARDPSCIYCGKRLTEASSTLDHAIPASKGGPDAPWNLWLCCKNCNNFKADRSVLELLEMIQRAAAKMGFIELPEELEPQEAEVTK